ncbi:sigma factor-like helix-turn-helix DNA-binding protein [Enterococcus gilvus]|uniref:sigma factor-like helix-turn-helix DNA-binding protein n=1 Tax=Enterococcus gilvus TaxID=160453 RepID=UPI003D6AFDB6
MAINEFRSDDRWGKIDYFLQSKGIESFDQIDESIIDELYFVPGVDYALINELKKNKIEVNDIEFQNGSPEASYQEDQKTSAEKSISSKVLDRDIVLEAAQTMESNILFKNKTEQEPSFWFSNYPWQMLLGKSFRVKGTIAAFLKRNNILTIKDFEEILPISRENITSGVSDNHLESFNRYMKSKLNLLKKTSSLEEIDKVVDGLNWQNFYSKIDLKKLAESLPSTVLLGKMEIIFEMFDIPTNQRVIKRVGGETLKDFLINRTEYEIPRVGKAELHKTYDLFFESLREQFLNQQTSNIQRYTIHIHEPVKSLKVSEVLDVFVEDDRESIANILNKYEIESMNDLEDVELNIGDYVILRPFFASLEKDYLQEFIRSIEELSANRKQILEGRVLGDSLQVISQGLNVTRERVRQIESLILTKLSGNADILARVLSKSRKFFYHSDVESLFQEDFLSMVFVWTLDKKSSQYEYLRFADLIVNQDIIGENISLRFFNIVESKAAEIGDIVNLYNAVFFDLEENNLYFISSGNFAAFLNKWLKFKTMNGIYVKPGVQEVDLLAYIIEEEFKNGIKLDSREDNKDLITFRKHIQRNFPQIKLPENNRALTARITRSERMVLRDRGIYIASSQIYIEDSLREDIFEWINEKDTTLTYNEVYECFKSRLFMESNIDNGNFLHGMLKHYYSDQFTFSRDFFTRIDSEVLTTDERIIKLLEINGTMTEQEITNEIPGLKEYQIFSICDRNARIFRAGIKKIALVDQVNFCKIDLGEIEQFIKQLLERNRGYISSKYLFNELSKSNLNKIIIENPDLDDLGIYQFILKKMNDIFLFRYPHIMDKQSDIKIKNLNSSSILESLFVNESGMISRDELERFKTKFQWSQLTIYTFLNESKQNLIRISRSQYATLEKSGVTDKTVFAIDQFFDNLNVAYYPTIDFNNFDLLPDVTFEWSHFLLEDIISKFSNHYRLIDREHSGTHFISSIIVKNTSELKDFEDVVIFELNKTGKKRFSLREIREYLSNKGLITDIVPQELEDGEKIRLNSRSEMFEIL